jgi:hypothetical protein
MLALEAQFPAFIKKLDLDMVGGCGVVVGRPGKPKGEYFPVEPDPTNISLHAAPQLLHICSTCTGLPQHL